MISYELIKQLKEAGFPKLNNAEIFFIDVDHTVPYFYIDDIPTLSELIEACGMSVQDCCISKTEDGKFYVVFKGSDDGHGNEIDYCLPTLEEVFAYHWLEINKV